MGRAGGRGGTARVALLGGGSACAGCSFLTNVEVRVALEMALQRPQAQRAQSAGAAPPPTACC